MLRRRRRRRYVPSRVDARRHPKGQSPTMKVSTLEVGFRATRRRRLRIRRDVPRDALRDALHFETVREHECGLTIVAKVSKPAREYYHEG